MQKQSRKKTYSKNQWVKKWGKSIVELIIHAIKLITALL